MSLHALRAYYASDAIAALVIWYYYRRRSRDARRVAIRFALYSLSRDIMGGEKSVVAGHAWAATDMI